MYLSSLVTCGFSPPPLFFSPTILLLRSPSLQKYYEGRVQQEVHLHLYHMCNVLSALMTEPSSMVSTWQFGDQMPVTSSLHPETYFTGTWQEQRWVLMQPVIVKPPFKYIIIITVCNIWIFFFSKNLTDTFGFSFFFFFRPFFFFASFSLLPLLLLIISHYLMKQTSGEDTFFTLALGK